MSQLALEHVSKTYPNGVQAVRDLNLSIGDGELVVLLGPSGCGKTTTLRLIAGEERVAVGRAIARRPGVFLLDEPLSQLDGRLRAELRHELHLLQRSLRKTMIYVTHDQTEAMTLADRLVVMDRGIVQQVDAPLAV